WSMKPQCVIKARRHQLLIEHRASVRDQGGIEEHQVRRVGEHALMDRCRIRQRVSGPYPDIESAVEKFLAEITLELDGTKFDRPFALKIAPYRIGHHRQDPSPDLKVARQLLRAGHLGHINLMA